MKFLSYKDVLSIEEGFDSGFVFPSAPCKVHKGEKIVVVANGNNSIEGYVINYTHTVPSYMVRRSFVPKGNKRSSYDGFGGIPLKRFTIPNEQFGMIQGGKVGTKDGSQNKIIDFLIRNDNGDLI